jgi:hypothetical protein
MDATADPCVPPGCLAGIAEEEVEEELLLLPVVDSYPDYDGYLF